jgi:hypothetical protein
VTTQFVALEHDSDETMSPALSGCTVQVVPPSEVCTNALSGEAGGPPSFSISAATPDGSVIPVQTFVDVAQERATSSFGIESGITVHWLPPSLVVTKTDCPPIVPPAAQLVSLAQLSGAVIVKPSGSARTDQLVPPSPEK